MEMENLNNISPHKALIALCLLLQSSNYAHSLHRFLVSLLKPKDTYEKNNIITSALDK